MPRKMIATDEADWAIYEKIAKALTKQIGLKIYVNGAIKIMAQEYVKNHPELSVK